LRMPAPLQGLTKPQPSKTGGRAHDVLADGCRRLGARCERLPRSYLALLGLAAALCCCERFVRLTA